MINPEDLTEEDKSELYWSHYYKNYEPEYEIPDPEESEVDDE